MPQNQKITIRPHDTTQALIAKYPAWTVLPQANIQWIQADHRIETDVDALGVGRVRVKPGYNVNIDEIRYGY